MRAPLRQVHRLRGYDYTLDGTYFVTIVAQDRAPLLGEVVDSELHPSIAGLVVESWWLNICSRFPTVLVDAHVAMPNHLHRILFIGGQLESDRPGKGGHAGPPLQQDVSENPSLGTIVQWFKTMTTNDYIRGVKNNGWPPFRKRLWQRHYYDHVIRNDRALANIRAYITNNPAQWDEDAENPANL